MNELCEHVEMFHAPLLSRLLCHRTGVPDLQPLLDHFTALFDWDLAKKEGVRYAMLSSSSSSQ